MSLTLLVDPSQRKMKFKERLKHLLGHEEFLKANIWKALIAEFLGTGFLVLVGCGSTTPWVAEPQTGPDKPPTEPSVVQIGLGFGLIVATMAQSIAHISGGHINPAITIGCLFNGRCSLIRASLFIVVQLVGACAGAAVLMGVTPSKLNSPIGTTALGPNMNGAQGLIVEFCITFVLVLTVLAVTDSNRMDLKGSGPLAIGLSISACHMWAIYWVGPLFGGLVAGLIYKFIFENPPSGEGPPDPLKSESEIESAIADQEVAAAEEKSSNV